VTNGSVEAPTIGIGRILREGSRYFVPHHQRDYSWSEDEIEQVLLDIEEARESGQDEYFLGLMVFMPTDRGYMTLDGQQRLATTIVLLSSIRRWLRDRGFDEDASKLQQDYIAERELGRSDQTPRLVLNEANNPVFEECVVREKATAEIEQKLSGLGRYDPNRRLYEAVLYCRARIDDLAGGSTTDQAAAARKLFQWVKFLHDQVKVVRLVVASEANAYTVFETLNDRGLDLTVLDLVKNHLFGKASGESQLRDTQARWTQMMANLSGVRADDFLKAWWTSRHGRVQTVQLFPKFKKLVFSSAAVREISEDMLTASEHFAALEVSDDPIWGGLSTATRDSIRALKLLGGRQVHPVLLSGIHKLKPRELERLVRLLEIVIVRYQLIGGGRTGRLEIACATLAHQIFQGKIETATDARQVLRDVYPADQDFKDAFRTKRETNSRKVLYLLKVLEIQERRRVGSKPGGIELVPGANLTVEHVLPKKPSSDWEPSLNADPELLEDCVDRLGNLCLLSNINRALGNKGFEAKRHALGESDLLLTRRVADERQWDRGAIEGRQTELATLAASAWRFE
jgi:hypothetical protein